MTGESDDAAGEDASLIEQGVALRSAEPHGASAQYALLALSALVLCLITLLLVLLWQPRRTVAFASVDRPVVPAGSLFASPLASTPHRYLGVLSCRERLANAVISFSQLLDMAAATHNTTQPMHIVAPTVLLGELGYAHHRQAQPFEAYFDLPALQRAGLPLLSMDEFVGVARPAVWVSTLLLPVQRLLCIDYEDRVEASGGVFDADGLSSCANLTLHKLLGIEPGSRHNVTSLSLGMAIDEVLCVRRDVDVPAMLDAVYAQLDPTRARTVYLYQHHRKLGPPPNAAAMQMFDHLAPRYAQLIAAQPWAGSYAVIQMRAGNFIRCGTPECRATAPPKMLACASKLANATLRAMREAGVEAVLVASDIYGTVPEQFAGESYDDAWAATQQLFESALGSRRVVAPVEQLDVAATDWIGASTLLDFQLAVQAHTLVAMGSLISTYTRSIVEARRRAGRDSIMVDC